MNNFISIVILLFLGLPNCIYGQLDTEFWFAAPEVSRGNNSLNLDRPIQLVLTAGAASANVQISMPANTTFVPLNINVPINSTVTVNLSQWIDLIETKPPNQILNNGIFIESSEIISAYYLIESGGGSGRIGDNPEVFTLKGKNALGLEFTIPGQNILDNDIARFTPLPTNSFDIVATENNTQVTITPKNNIVGHAAANGPFTLTMNKGQTYSATAISNLGVYHLNGSNVISNKPISIMLKDDLLMEGIFVGWCSDLVGEQIVPNDILGTEYIAISTNLNSPGDQLFITATEDNTQIFSGTVNTPIAIINKNETFQIGINGESISIRSNNPIAVWQIAGGGCEFGATLLPPIYCTGSRSVSYVRIPGSHTIYFNILVEAGHQNNFLINNQPLTNPIFNYVPGTNNQWMFCKYFVSYNQIPSNNVIKVTNSSSKFHLSVVDISAGGTSYGYFSDYSQGANVQIEGEPRYCIGDNFSLQLYNSVFDSIRWTRPNGLIDSISNISISNAENSHSGWYKVYVEKDGCVGSDSIFVDVMDYVSINMNLLDSIFCKGDTINVSIDSIVLPFNWRLNEAFATVNPYQIKFPVNQPMWINVDFDDRYCIINDSLFVEPQNITPNVEIKVENTILDCLNPITTLTGVGASNYEWYDFNQNLIGNTATLTHKFRDNNYIFLKGFDNNINCFGLDSVYISIVGDGNVWIPNAFSPNSDGVNDIFIPNFICPIDKYEIKVFNRFGELVFTSKNIDKGWDGNYKGRAADVGVYYWDLNITFSSGVHQYHKGDLTLLR